MKPKGLFTLSIFLVISLIVSILPGCSPSITGDNYMAIVPKILHSGGTESISLALFQDGKLVKGNVEVTLLRDNQEVVTVKETVNGKGTVEFDVPDIEEGEYTIKVKGAWFEDSALVNVEKSFLVLVETDKPIYKPGQTIHIRTLTLDSELKPLTETVTIDVLDAKGIKIFRKDVQTDEYGMTDVELPLSTEPNLGVWKINAVTEKGSTQLDVRVERYVLPKYEVSVELPKQWFLVNEPVEGQIKAEYSFGKPVSGELEIVASRYVGEWQEYARFTAEIDGEAEFTLPSVGYVAGVPAAGGQGNVTLDITVTEQTTGYKEETTRLLTVSESPMTMQIIPESLVFKPGLPFSFLLITETPDNEPVDTQVTYTITYLDEDYNEVSKIEKRINTSRGKAIIDITPPGKSVALIIDAYTDETGTSKTLEATYSPSGNFIHVEQISEGIPQIGQNIRFKVYSTRRASNFYYEVVSRDKVIFSDYTGSSEISFATTPLMAPSSKLLVYQILPNSEVAADFIPFKVQAEYPHEVTAEFNKEEVEPGEEVSVDISTEGQARVGIAAVDKSVFILAENRLNLQQVFDELEKLYMMPQIELHEASIYPSITTRGASDIFDDAGVIVLSNNEIPEGEEHEAAGSNVRWDMLAGAAKGGFLEVEEEAEMAVPAADSTATTDDGGAAGLAEVQRVRQYFPETWLWQYLTTDNSGKVSLPVNAPDTITTWMLRAVAISKDNGLGIAEDSLTVFQPFFLKIDLPYSAIRGEEFPVKIAVYNYLEQPQSVQVEIQQAEWFDLLDSAIKTVELDANDIGGIEFMIRPTKLGINDVEISARSNLAADAMIKTIIIEPEGVSREIVENLVLATGTPKVISTEIPFDVVPDSGRAYFAVTSSYLTQTIDGLEGLLQMPFGCGEQNMIMMAPNTYVTKYLEESGQLKPEIMAKAEKLMITGYQRQLTYRRNDGSFSAFGQSDNEGSLWLTAFVLKVFAQTKDIIYIDSDVLNEARTWITSHQNADGSFDPVGFVHHQEILGGMSGKEALTAFTAIALLEAGENISAGKAVDYLEGKLNSMDDPYTLAITAYALELAQSEKRDDAHLKLMELAKEDENGLHWGDEIDILPQQTREYGNYNQSANIETTAYATLALVKRGDAFNASRSAKWLVAQRNAYGGYGSTQDTVVSLQALTEYSTGTRADVNLTVKLTGEGINRELRITQDNYDVLQIIDLPVNTEIEVSMTGEGEAIGQLVKRFNIPDVEETTMEIFNIHVDYDTTEVEVNDIVKVSVDLTFTPPQPMEAGMIVLDISIPTGFAPVVDTIAQVIEQDARMKRYEVAGRKVIFYIENMFPNDTVSFSFDAQALYPVKAKGVTSEVYSYYQPELRGETLGQEVTVLE